jgi:hypothetical protein
LLQSPFVSYIPSNIEEGKYIYRRGGRSNINCSEIVNKLLEKPYNKLEMGWKNIGHLRIS